MYYQQPTPLASLHQLVQTMDVFQRGGGWGGGSGGLGRELGPLKELLHLARTELDTERLKATVQVVHFFNLNHSVWPTVYPITTKV